jgi:hypothetical protein
MRTSLMSVLGPLTAAGLLVLASSSDSGVQYTCYLDEPVRTDPAHPNEITNQACGYIGSDAKSIPTTPGSRANSNTTAASARAVPGISRASPVVSSERCLRRSPAVRATPDLPVSPSFALMRMCHVRQQGEKDS